MASSLYIVVKWDEKKQKKPGDKKRKYNKYVDMASSRYMLSLLLFWFFKFFGSN